MILTIATIILLGTLAWNKWITRNKVKPETVKVRVKNEKPFNR
ncbi:hypothetical protein [Maribellus sp. YY47]|nr:hypothetical protein [Maribellus sp. YY47]